MSWTSFAIAFDLHGSEAHAPTVKAFHRFCADFKPQRRIIGGDVWDFPRLRRGADGSDTSKPLTPDFDAGCEFIGKFKPDTILLGNHDARLWRAAEDKGHRDNEIAATLLKSFDKLRKDIGFTLVPYSKAKVVKCGPLNVLHGFYAGESACKKHAAVYGPAIFGHVHSAESASVPRHGERHEAWSSPCMMRLDPAYAEQTPSTLRWRNGWIYGQFDGKRYHVDTAIVENGAVVYAPKFVTRAA